MYWTSNCAYVNIGIPYFPHFTQILLLLFKSSTYFGRKQVEHEAFLLTSQRAS